MDHKSRAHNHSMHALLDEKVKTPAALAKKSPQIPNLVPSPDVGKKNDISFEVTPPHPARSLLFVFAEKERSYIHDLLSLKMVAIVTLLFYFIFVFVFF